MSMKMKSIRLPEKLIQKIDLKLLANKHNYKKPDTWKSLIEFLLEQWIMDSKND